MAVPSFSTDQIAAFLELARSGSLRQAATGLHITEQGLRNRLVSLEQRLGVELYRKMRGRRSAAPLTPQGRQFLPKAMQYMDAARGLADCLSDSSGPDVIHVAASQYLILYVLIDAVRRFHIANPRVRVRLSNLTEQEIEDRLLRDVDVAFGLSAPYDTPQELEYRNLFGLQWSLITPSRHRLSRKRNLSLRDLRDEPMIFFERGSAGRQHVIDAFQTAGVTPRIETETTNTEIIVRMVEAGLGVALVPLLASGAVTKGRKVVVRSMARLVRPIQSGILKRRNEKLTPSAEAFLKFL